MGESESTSGPPGDPRPKRRTLALDSGAVFAIAIVIQLIGYVPTHFLARSLGQSGMGQGQALLGLIQTFLLLATSITNLGDLRIGTAYTFFVSRGQHPNDATTTYFAIRVAMVAVAGVTLLAFAPSFGLTTKILGVPDAPALEIFGVWMLLPVLWSTSTVYGNLWTSLGDAARGQLPTLVESIVRAGALTLVAFELMRFPQDGLGSPVTTLWLMTAAYVAGAVASSLVSVTSLWTYRGRVVRAAAVRLFRWSWPLMGSMVLLYLSGNLISFVVIYYLHEAAFNIFNAANAFRTLALALPAAIAVPLFPHMSSLHKSEAFQAIRSRTWQTVRFTAVLVVPGVLAFAVYRVNILNIVYAQSYLSGSTALAILAFAAIPAALSQIIGTTMTSIGRTRLELYITSLQVACLVVVSLLFVQPPPAIAPYLPAYLTGLNGAALALLVSSIGAFALNAYFLYTLLGVRLQVTSMGWIFVSAAASFLAVSRLNTLLPVNRYYQLALGIVLGFAVYLFVLALVGELSREDVDQVIRSAGLPLRLSTWLGRLCWRVGARPVNAMPAGGARALVPLEAEWSAEPATSERPPPGP